MPGKPRLDVGAIRALAETRIKESSLRSVADEIGVSKSGLDSFIRGRDPYAKTRIKLAAWFMRQSRPDSASVARDELEGALAILERYMDSAPTPAAKRRRVREVETRLFPNED